MHLPAGPSRTWRRARSTRPPSWPACRQCCTRGRGALGTLGHGDEEDSLIPRPVRALSGIGVRSVSCGAYHTAAVGEGGDLFIWGWQQSRHLRQLDGGGAGCAEGYATSPQRVDARLMRVRAVTCGHYATAAVTASSHVGQGRAWAAGARPRARHHRAGAASCLQQPRLCVTHAGRYFLMVLTSEEKSSCGASEHGVLGRRIAPGSRAYGVGLGA